jgi:disulfide bond formation protein DsbB
MTRTPVLAGLSLLVALGALAVAFGSEWYGGLVPCALCLVERWPYRVAAVVAVIALLPLRLRWVLWGVVLCMAASVAFASVHVGVEQKWWPSPLPECAAPNLGGGSIAERLARMPAHPAKPCDDPTFLVPGVPVSMAAMNGLAALVFGLFLAISLLRPKPYGAPNERLDPARRSHAS